METTQEQKQIEIPQHSVLWSRILFGVMTLVLIGAVAVGAYFVQKKFFAKDEPTDQATTNTITPTDSVVAPPSDNTVASGADAPVVSDVASLIDKTVVAEKVADDFAVTGEADTFPTTQDSIAILAQTKSVKEGMQVKIEWYYKTGATRIDAANFISKKGINTFVTSLPSPSPAWPEGEYEVKIYLDGALAKIATFSITP